MDDLPDFDAFGGEKVLHHPLQRGSVERLGSGQAIAELAQQASRLRRLAKTLLEVFVVNRYLLVGQEKLRIIEDIAGYFDAIASRFQDGLQLRPDLARRRL